MSGDETSQGTVALSALDHVNIRTERVDALAAFYAEILGLVRGPRPPFAFGGAWLYCGDRAVVHLVEVEAGSARPQPRVVDPAELQLSHFAFRASGLRAFLARLNKAGVQHAVGRLPGAPITQVNLRDLDGNALHVDFTEELV
jgi:catechol 2,3-dioxygenase-like lactoylglutathione lyase family enzyme